MSDVWFEAPPWYDDAFVCTTPDWLDEDPWWCPGWICVGGAVVTRRRHRLTMQHFIDTDRRTLNRRFR